MMQTRGHMAETLSQRVAKDAVRLEHGDQRTFPSLELSRFQIGLTQIRHLFPSRFSLFRHETEAPSRCATLAGFLVERRASGFAGEATVDFVQQNGRPQFEIRRVGL